MILTDEELRAAYMAALLTSRETSMARCERDALRGVEDAVVERLAQECDINWRAVAASDNGILAMPYAEVAEWLRSKVNGNG